MEKSEIIVNDFPRSPVSESFRLFRTNLLYLFENDESKVISLTSSNAGEGKSWVTANLAISCAQYGKKVLIVDLDPQGNSTTGLGIDKADIKKSIYDLLIDKAELKDVIKKTKFRNLFIIPATISLAGADIELMEQSRINPEFSKNGQLKKHTHK